MSKSLDINAELLAGVREVEAARAAALPPPWDEPPHPDGPPEPLTDADEAELGRAALELLEGLGS